MQKMTKRRAAAILAEIVADYITNRHPIEGLVGSDDDVSALHELADALRASGQAFAADMVSRRIVVLLNGGAV